MSVLSRLGLGFGTALLLGLAVWWGMLRSSPPPSQHSVGEITAPVSVAIGPEEGASVRADASLDALTGLGYAHGLQHSWTIALWRRTALGRLSEWFGPGTRALDRHALRLGLGRHARAAYDELPDSTQEQLRAYVRGLNAALDTEHVRDHDSFVLLERSPSPWEPWHPLAIERLLAWLGTEPISAPASAPDSVRDFRRADHQLRRWLHLHGWSRSVLWALPDPSGSSSTLFHRHVLGATADAPLQEVSLKTASAGPLRGVTFPGLPALPTGTRDGLAWGVLMTSPASLNRIEIDSSSQEQWHERLSPSGASEALVRVRRQGTALPLAAVPPDSGGTPPDSAWALRWPGFSSQTDLPAWLSTVEATPDTPSRSFRLLEGSGLRVSSEGEVDVMGDPPVVEQAGDQSALVVGASDWSRHHAASLAEKRPLSPEQIAHWSTSDSSTWASELLAQYQSDLQPFSEAPAPASEALPYLQNWDHRYDRASIGASLFEYWMQAYRADLGHRPTPSGNPYFGSHRRQRAFQRALDTLTARFGSDVRQWRWERVTPDRRYFPVWSADSLVADDLSSLASTRYAPLNRPGRGHPSALAGGPSLLDPLPVAPSPTSWDGWMRPHDTTLTVRRLQFDPGRFFGRSLLSPDRPPAHRLAPSQGGSRTTLVPTDSP
ncbi:MAG: penicillin acylase family protein [Salinivenus sp.]